MKTMTYVAYESNKPIIIKTSSHQNLAADMRREISRRMTAIVDRMIKVMLYPRRDVDRSLNTLSILTVAKNQSSLKQRN